MLQNTVRTFTGKRLVASVNVDYYVIFFHYSDKKRVRLNEIDITIPRNDSVNSLDSFSSNLQTRISRKWLGSTSIPDYSSHDAISASELSFGEPKSAHSKSCLLCFAICHVFRRRSNHLHRSSKCITRLGEWDWPKRTKDWCKNGCSTRHKAIFVPLVPDLVMYVGCATAVYEKGTGPGAGEGWGASRGPEGGDLACFQRLRR